MRKNFGMKSDLVSVNITTFNRAHLLSRCLNSVLNQSYKNIEVIIVDDASTDHTEDIVKKFQLKYDQIFYFKHKKNKGNARARNTALKKCNGIYVAFLDDDDEWIDENKIKKQVEIFQRNNDNKLGIVCSGIIRHTHDGFQSKEKPNIPKNLKSRILKGGGLIHNSTVLTKKSILNELNGFNTELPRGIDYEFFIRLVVLHNYKVSIIDELTCKYYEDSPNRMTEFGDDNVKWLKNTRYLQIYIFKKYLKFYLMYPSSIIDRLIVTLKLQLKIIIFSNLYLKKLLYKD